MARKSKRSVKKSRRSSWKRPARKLYSERPSKKASKRRRLTEDDREDRARSPSRKSRKAVAKKSATKRSASSVLRAGRIKRAQNLAQKAIDEGQSVSSAMNKYILPMADRECDTEWEAEKLVSKCKSALSRGTSTSYASKGTIKAKKQKLSVAAILIKEVIPKAKSIGVSPKKLKEIEKILRDASERKATRSSRRREEY